MGWGSHMKGHSDFKGWVKKKKEEKSDSYRLS